MKIAVYTGTIGAAHLPGVIELLKEQELHWKVVSVKWMRTIEAPKQLERNL